MVTAPVQKSVINDAGIAFTGHTEYLAERAHAARGDDAGGRRPARRARHHAPALHDVPARDHARGRSSATLRILDARPARALRHRAAAHPGRRPQSARRRGRPPRARGDRGDRAGCSSGCAREGMDVVGPAARRHALHAAHARRAPTACSRCTTTRACRCSSTRRFGAGVNVTLGLPFVRTSVDHGTALDLAGTGARRRRQPVRGASTSRSRMAGATRAAA